MLPQLQLVLLECTMFEHSASVLVGLQYEDKLQCVFYSHCHLSLLIHVSFAVLFVWILGRLRTGCRADTA